MPPARAEPNKSQLIWEDRYLNSMCKHSPFQTDGLRKVAQCSCKGAQQVTPDQKSQDIPIPTWFDKLWVSIFRATRDFGPSDQQAHEAAGSALVFLYHCRYFMAFPKCLLEPTTDSISLGVGCDTAQRRHYVPEGKLLKSEASPIGRLTAEVMYKYARSGIAGQPVCAPRVPPGAAFKRSGGQKNLPSIAVSDRKVVRGEDPAEQGAVARCHPTRSDHYRGHRRLTPSMERPDSETFRPGFLFQISR